MCIELTLINIESSPDKFVLLDSVALIHTPYVSGASLVKSFKRSCNPCIVIQICRNFFTMVKSIIIQSFNFYNGKNNYRVRMTTTGNLGINCLKNSENLMFGQRVAYVIETSGLSKAWIAEKLGISKQALNYLLKHSINPKFVDEFAELLKLDPKWLETGEGNPSIRSKENRQSTIMTLPVITKSELLTHTRSSGKNRETVEFSRANPETFTAYKLEDNSNFPPFIEGSILIFDTQKLPNNEDFVLSIIENNVFVRQYLVDGDNICYKAGNGGHKTFINPTARLLGVLVEARYQVS